MNGNPRYICAGGYVLSLLSKWKIPFGDIDLFMRYDDWKAIPLEPDMEAYMYQGFAMVKHHGKLQYIYLSIADFDPMEIIQTFDITICQVALYGGKIYMTDDAKEDIEKGTFHIIKENVRNLDLLHTRRRKYIKRGFKYAGFLESLDDILGLTENGPQIDLKAKKRSWKNPFVKSQNARGWRWAP